MCVSKKMTLPHGECVETFPFGYMVGRYVTLANSKDLLHWYNPMSHGRPALLYDEC